MIGIFEMMLILLRRSRSKLNHPSGGLFCLWHIEIDEGQGFPLTPWLLLCIPAVQIVFVIIHFESNLIKKCVRFGYHLSIVCLGLRGREKD